MSTYNDTTKETVAYVVFDIGKNVHAMAAYADQELRPIVKPEYILADQTGFERAGVVLDELLTGGKYDRIVVGHEPTGVYHEAWARALCDRYANALRPESRPYIDYQFLNPYQTKQDRKRILGRNRKTDFLDLAAIARCLADGAGSPAYLPRAQDLVFQQWAASYYQGVRARRRLTIQLLSAFDRVWPGALRDFLFPTSYFLFPSGVEQTPGAEAGSRPHPAMPRSACRAPHVGVGTGCLFAPAHRARQRDRSPARAQLRQPFAAAAA